MSVESHLRRMRGSFVTNIDKDAPITMQERLRALSNDAAERAGVPFMEAAVYGYAMTVLQEAKAWHRLVHDPVGILSIDFYPKLAFGKIVVGYRDRDGIERTVKHP